MQRLTSFVETVTCRACDERAEAGKGGPVKDWQSEVASRTRAGSPRKTFSNRKPKWQTGGRRRVGLTLSISFFGVGLSLRQIYSSQESKLIA